MAGGATPAFFFKAALTLNLIGIDAEEQNHLAWRRSSCSTSTSITTTLHTVLQCQNKFMHLALQRLLVRFSATFVRRGAVHSIGPGVYQHYFFSTTARGQSRRYTAGENKVDQSQGSEARAFRIRKIPAKNKDDGNGKGGIERNRPDTAKVHAHLPHAQKCEAVEGPKLSGPAAGPDEHVASVTQDNVRSSNLGFRTQLGLPGKAEGNLRGWRRRLVTLEQYQYQSSLWTTALQGPRLVDNPSYTQDWELWLELIAFRRRHFGTNGTILLYKEIFRQDLQLPTDGTVANQLWDLLVRAGFHDSGLLDEMLIYATRLKWSTRRFWSGLYYGIVSIALKKDPDSAYSWHVKLRDDFPPSLTDYQKLFKLSLEWGRSAHFRDLYRDVPLKGMYKTVISHLCEVQMYEEALKWHDLLCRAGDFPAGFPEIKPLLDHLVYIGDKPRFETIVRQLAVPKAKIEILNVAEDSVEKDTGISREIVNRLLGEVHGVAPKHLSDSFCARLFATRLFSVDTIINGLHMMAAEAIGPLSLREIAVRDDCDPAAICHHIDRLGDAGITIENSVFCTLLRSSALENKRGILKSIVDCDLHPDAFADRDLQERLLAQYYHENDLMKIERTFAILTVGLLKEKLQMRQMNLYLRCQITLGQREKVLAKLEEMKHLGVPVSARSSRHLRVRWISRRQVGRGAATTQELAILIQASQMTMQSGRFVPMKAWKEILRRLGMAGRLREFENLALWLVDWYLSPTATAVLTKGMSLTTRKGRTLVKGQVSSGESWKQKRRKLSETLFTISARHAIVAWGFQHTTRSREIRRFKMFPTIEDPMRLQGTTRYQWTWGLHLLHKLKERGLYIQPTEVARICRHRLQTLFGAGVSKRKINRVARSDNDALESYTKDVYIQKMKEIWGENLFRVGRRRKLQKALRPRIRFYMKRPPNYRFVQTVQTV